MDSFKAIYGSIAIAAIMGLNACASVPEIREIDGPIVLDAPDSVVNGGQTPAITEPVTQNYPEDDGVQIVTSVPVTTINCPAGSSPHTDGSCLLD